MSSIPDGSYHLYATEKVTRPIVVEIMANYVAQAGEEGWRPIAHFVGKFVRLREVEAVLPDEKYERE
jgi:hypothetical protein